MRARVCVHAYMCMYLCMCMGTYVHVCMRRACEVTYIMYVCMYVCVCMCMSVCAARARYMSMCVSAARALVCVRACVCVYDCV